MPEKKSNGQFAAGHKAYVMPPEERTARKEMKLLVEDLLFDHLQDFEDSWIKLKVSNPKAFCDIYLRLLEHKLPKLKAVQLDEETVANPAMSLLKKFASYDKQETKH